MGNTVRKRGFKSLDFHKVSTWQNVCLFNYFSNLSIKLCSSIGKRILLLQNCHCTRQKNLKPAEALGYVTTNNHLKAGKNNMSLRNPAVSDFNHLHFSLMSALGWIEVTVSQRPYVVWARLLQVSSAKAGAIFSIHWHLSNKTKQNNLKQKRYFISIYNVLKLYFTKKCELWKGQGLQCQTQNGWGMVEFHRGTQQDTGPMSVRGWSWSSHAT